MILLENIDWNGKKIKKEDGMGMVMVMDFELRSQWPYL
jgi:hypothetical protein